MKKRIKGFLCTFLAMLLLLQVIPISGAQAASTRKCYTISSSNTIVFSNTGLTTRYGTIYPSDELTVLSVYSNYSKVTYPVSGGKTKTGYISTKAILLGTSGKEYTSTGKITTYRRNNTSNTYGYVAKGDRVTVLGTSGNYTQIKYPTSVGYKYAFIKNTDANTYLYGKTNTTTSLKEVYLDNGIYTFASGLSASKCMDVQGGGTKNGTNIQLYQWNDTTSQGFLVERLSNGWYHILNMKSGMAIDVSGGIAKNEVNIQLYRKNDSAAQLWKFYNAGNGYVYIKNKLGYYLEVWNNKTSNGTNIQTYSFNGGNNQKWKVEYKNIIDIVTKSVLSELYMDTSGISDGWLKVYFYYDNFNHGKKYDIKRENRWKEMFPDVVYPGLNGKFKLGNKVVTPEDLGNIIYGFVGRYLGISSRTIFQGGGYAASGMKYINSPQNYYGDSKKDHDWIEFGIKLLNTKQTIDFDISKHPTLYKIAAKIL